MGVYQVDVSKIVGGPGRLVVAPYGSVTFPQRIEEVMETTGAYTLQSPWRDVGATTEGIKISRGFETEDFEVDQVIGPVETEITSWMHTITTQLAESTVENRQLALIGGTITETQEEIGLVTTLSEAVPPSSSRLKLEDVTGLAQGSFIRVTSMKEGTSEVRQLAKADPIHLQVHLTKALINHYEEGDSVVQITQPLTQRMGYGTSYHLPTWTVALISQKKDGTLMMVVFYRCQVTGDEKEFEFSKSKRVIPLQLKAMPESSAEDHENVYYEIEQLI